MESRDFEAILDTMADTGVYVIREEDQTLLYINRRVRKTAPKAAPGTPFREVWSGPCRFLSGMEERGEYHTVTYNAGYDGIVDISAARILWEGRVPAFAVTVIPRNESAGYTYRKILYVDLARDRCNVLKSDPEGWLPREEASLSAQLGDFARSGAIHPEDVERFAAFTRLDRLRAAPMTGEQALTVTYRRRVGDDYRWNLMELVPDMAGAGQPDSAILCVKDVHKVLREGLQREGLAIRSQDLIRSLGERNFNIYTIDLESGSADPIRIDGQMQDGLVPEPWEELMRRHIKDRLHEAYLDEFDRRFSLEGLRQAKAKGEQKSELLCQWRSGENYRYISVTAYFNQELKPKSYTILALQDVEERTRQELAHTKRNMQMAAILKSRFQSMMTVSLDSGQYEELDLAQAAGPGKPTTGDYNAYLQTAFSSVIYPDDLKNCQRFLTLEHLREKAESTEDYAEEVCLFRLRNQPVRWMELRVLYSRRNGQVMVNILKQDVTKEKNLQNSQLQALEDRAHIITSLSSLFFSTYYIDLEQNTFRAVQQLRRVTDVLGEEVNYTAALRLYANHFIHPDDREEYLKIMDIQNLRQNLRWWQPCIAVEYRRLPDLPGDRPEEGSGLSWVRASAVLACTGEDDIPKNVVYVAQDISVNRHKLSAPNGV